MKGIVTASVKCKPQFNDIDPMNVVWHGNYPKYLELARVAVLDRIEYNYPEMTASGFAWPITDMQIRYAQPIRLHQEIEVHAGIVEWKNRLKIAFEIRDVKSGKRLTRAYSVQVAVEIETEQMLWETPPILAQKLAPFL